MKLTEELALGAPWAEDGPPSFRAAICFTCYLHDGPQGGRKVTAPGPTYTMSQGGSVGLYQMLVGEDGIAYADDEGVYDFYWTGWRPRRENKQS